VVFFTDEEIEFPGSNRFLFQVHCRGTKKDKHIDQRGMAEEATGQCEDEYRDLFNKHDLRGIFTESYENNEFVQCLTISARDRRYT
jgi:hypothetical protein